VNLSPDVLTLTFECIAPHRRGSTIDVIFRLFEVVKGKMSVIFTFLN